MTNRCPCCGQVVDLHELESIGVQTMDRDPMNLVNCECGATMAVRLLPWPAELEEAA